MSLVQVPRIAGPDVGYELLAQREALDLQDPSQLWVIMPDTGFWVRPRLFHLSYLSPCVPVIIYAERATQLVFRYVSEGTVLHVAIHLVSL